MNYQKLWLAILQYDILKMANKDQINKRVGVMTYFTIVMVTIFCNSPPKNHLN